VERSTFPILSYSETFEEPPVLNVAAICQATRLLGPGWRAVVWVQGCPFTCPGCIAPNWIPIRPARLVNPEELVDELLADPRVTGLTFSGGEPMLQADALAILARAARFRRPSLDIICYTGYHRSQLERFPPSPGVDALLDQLDVLIDGPYVAHLNDNLGLRGSRNQRIHYLTNRIKPSDLENAPRRAEVRLAGGQPVLVGVPPLNFPAAPAA